MNYAKSLKSVPQTQPLVNHPEMVKNNAGGYVFPITGKELLERFLLIGTEGGTYYASESKLTQDNAKAIIKLIKSHGIEVLQVVEDSIKNNRAPKVDPAIFVLALLCTYGEPEVKEATYTVLHYNLRTATNLFMFVSQVNELRGWSAGLRKAVARWYLNKSEEKLAYQLVKYRNREGFTHRDVLRLAHPKAKTDSQNTLFKWTVGKIEASEVGNNLISAYAAASKTTEASTVCMLINEFGLTWEMIPTEFLNDKEVLKALLVDMPTVAMIRNLGRFAKAGLTDGNTETTLSICSKLNEEAILKSGIHPVNLVNSLKTYAQGKGDKSTSTWPVNQKIVDALQDAYYFAIKNIVPTNKNILVALDVSGSMNSDVMKSSFSAAQLGAVLSLTLLNAEPNMEFIAFDTQLKKVPLNKRTPIDQAINASVSGGGTDCSIAFQYALAKKIKYDAILILTDNETWAGNTHGATLLNKYRNKYNKDVKVVEIAMTSNPYSTLPEDKNLLRTVGFDAALVQVINNFIK